jgi:hypothetical protein
MSDVDIQQATRTHYCKFPSCTNEARSPVGRYAYCDQHQGQSNGATGAKASGSVASRLGGLQAQAKAVDKLRAKAERLTRDALTAKRDADDAERSFRVALAALTADDA